MSLTKYAFGLFAGIALCGLCATNPHLVLCLIALVCAYLAFYYTYEIVLWALHKVILGCAHLLDIIWQLVF